MKKLMEKEASYYRLNLHAGNILYFSHAKDVREDEYTDLDIKDVVAKVDELVEAYNALTIAMQNPVSNTVSIIKEETITALQAQIDALKASKVDIRPQDIKLD